MILRSIVPKDYATVSEITVTSYAPYIPGDADYFDVLADVAGRAQCSDLVVAEVDGTVVGAIAIVDAGTKFAEVAEPGEIEFRMIAVAPEARGYGVGSAMVAHGLEVARQRGCRAVVLSTLETMVDARRIYVRFGFVDAPHRKIYRTVDVMELAL
ncbi:GNAT family N-acetyltransferase [Hoyosella rhizosphaerae]|nr:GNAT family N-acetyltransferase [Hoyosella rhizosphaerae]